MLDLMHTACMHAGPSVCGTHCAGNKSDGSQVLVSSADAITGACADSGAAAAASAPTADVKPKPEAATAPAPGTAPAGAGAMGTDTSANGETLWKLGGSKFASVSDFKGKRMVGLREHYQKEGSGWLPGKKGISLSIEQFEALVAGAPVRIWTARGALRQ